MEIIEAHEMQTNRQETEEKIKPSEEIQETPIPPEDVEKRRPIL